MPSTRYASPCRNSSRPGIIYTTAAAKAMPQIDGQRLLRRIRQENERLLDHVPIVDKDQNGDGIERRAALRQTDAPEDLPLARAVQLGRFDQRYRDTPHELREQKY